MPHFVIEYTAAENTPSPTALMQITHDAAVSSGVFAESAIKVRVKSYDAAMVGGVEAKFAHVLIYLIEGRDAATKKALTEAVHAALAPCFNGFQSISVDARDLEKAVYTKTTAPA